MHIPSSMSWPSPTTVKHITVRLCWYLWMAIHFYLPSLYRIIYGAKFFLPCSSRGIRDYQSFLRLGEEWRDRVIDLRDHWKIFQSICLATLGIAAPYLATTKAPVHSLTFSFGSICLVFSFFGVIFAHIYAGNADSLLNPVVVDYWLEASCSEHGVWFWTLLSLPAVWILSSVCSFLIFVVISVWEDVPSDGTSAYTRVLCHRMVLLSVIAWAALHIIMIASAWPKVKHRR